MKFHLPWIRVTAAAVLMAGVGVHPAAAQYAPYRPIPPQPAAPAVAAPAAVAPAAQQPAQAAATTTPYTTAYTAYRTPPAAPPSPYASTAQPAPAYGTPQPTAAYSYGSPTGAQYMQPTAAYPQYPQTSNPYSAYAAYPRVAQQPTPENIPAPSKSMSTSAAQPANGMMMPTPAAGAPAGEATMSAAQPGGCGCNAMTYGAGDYYTAPGCGCGASGGYPNCNINQYFNDNECGDNQWFGGVYFLEMGRTNATPVKLTSQMPTGGSYPYYPQPNATVLTNRDADFNFREGVEVRFGSTFTIGDSCSACQSPCGYNMNGCGCNSCGPQTIYAWEVAWWGLNDDEEGRTVMYDGVNRIYGMKSYVGLEYDRDGAGATYGYRPVNDYYDYEMPIIDPNTATIPAGTAGYVRVMAQRVRTDFRAENLELNLIRFPMCGCATGCSSGGCGGGGCDTCGCNSNYTGCNSCGCEDSCGSGFSMYGSCGVRWFRLDDEFLYGSESQIYDGSAYGPSSWLTHNIDVENNLVGPQIGWTSDYCCGKWNLFLNSTFGIFNNHINVWNRMHDDSGNWARYSQDGSTFNVRSNKDNVAFLGELRVGTAYDFTCHWRGVIAYRAVAMTGIATADEQLQNAYTDRWTTSIIDSDNSVVIHGVQVGVECRY